MSLAKPMLPAKPISTLYPFLQGKIVAEEYASQKNITAATRLFSFSLAKSVANAVLGLRIKDGAVSLDDLIDLPAWGDAVSRQRNITGMCPPMCML
jgi:hypothetical protein